ncbi:esterase/lipase family protein [Nakamurella sp.]|uniref:esterase/lipase family protein n=1 Tax=Nakamurella sp. TaxID=1869182 RepID=UPI003B3A9A34
MRRTILAAFLLVGTVTGAAGCGGPAPVTGPSVSPSVPDSVPPSVSPSPSVPVTGPSAAPSAPSSAVPASLPDVHLPGVNDPGCRSDHPPVVLLPGTFSTVAGTYGPLATALTGAGRCVYGANYGLGGLAPVRDSATTVAGVVEGVLAATGADRVDVVAYSQGGLVLRTALRQDGLADRVGTAVLIAPTFHGTTSPLLDGVPGALCPACADQIAGSALLTELDAGGDLDGSVRYATISSRDDTVVTPVAAQSPAGPADRVTSLVVQDRCPQVRLDHVALPGDPRLIAWVGAALAAGGRPEPSAFPCAG